MKYYSSCTLILLLVHQYFAQDNVDQVTDTKTKNAVEELLNKINDISIQSFSSAPYVARLQMLQHVERKLKQAAKSLGTKGDRYVKLVMQGLKAKALINVSENNKTQVGIPTQFNNISMFQDNNDNHDAESHNIREKIDDLRTVGNIILRREKKTKSKEMKSNDDFVIMEDLRLKDVVTNESNEYDKPSNSVDQETNTESLIKTLTTRYECEDSLNKICLNIKETRQIKCHFDDSIIPIEKLCDGSIDCTDRTDEKFCTSQVTERIQNANRVIRKIDKSYQLGCFLNKTKNVIMTKQIIILRSILESQQEFVEKYKHFNHSLIPNGVYFHGEGTVKRAVNELSVIISNLALVLNAELCSEQINTEDGRNARKFNDLVIEDLNNFDKVMGEVEPPIKSCICKGGRCENMTTCSDSCKRVCWQKHSLTQWRCPSVNETESVPVDVICDGKFDCFDQSDEKDCVAGISFAKFEAHNMFKEILASLSVKLTSKEYAFIRNMLLDLHSSIENLQKFCMASELDLKIIRALRNKCLSSLSSIYSETLTKASYRYQKSEIYLFLLSLSENIVNALKHSHTGNKRIISNEGCYCRNGRCVMPICSRNCLRFCVAEPWLTRYFCDDPTNTSVPLEAICNGKINCPKEDDENNCQKEICRRHHLTMFRSGLQKIGKKQEGTSMGELLASWKLKVSSTLLIAENNDRPNPNDIRDIVKDILNDLLMTYGAVKDYRRDNEYALQEFTNIARYVMRFLRSCSY